MASAETTSEPGAGWDEAQCTAALAQLERLQAQIDDLRLAIPRIIEPFHLPAKPSTFKLYADGVMSAQNGVKELHEAWRDPEMEKIFEHTKKSQSANADFSAATSVPDHGWVAREKRERKSRDGARSEPVERTVSLTHEDIASAVLELQKSQPAVKLTLLEDKESISIHFVTNGAKLDFRVHIERDANGAHDLTAECLGNTELSRAITRCIASRPQPQDLKYLLDMIVAYKLVKGASCAKCAKFLDQAAMAPAARRIQQGSESETGGVVWDAFHERCL